jgi:hypothetical protein
MTNADDTRSMQYIRELSGNGATPGEIADALRRTEALLKMVARVWEVPAADLPPAATYSAAWENERE